MRLIIEVDGDKLRTMKTIDDPDAKFYLKSVSGDGLEEETIPITMMWTYPDVPKPREGN